MAYEPIKCYQDFFQQMSFLKYGYLSIAEYTKEK